MISLIVISVIIAAFNPVISKRLKSGDLYLDSTDNRCYGNICAKYGAGYIANMSGTIEYCHISHGVVSHNTCASLCNSTYIAGLRTFLPTCEFLSFMYFGGMIHSNTGVVSKFNPNVTSGCCVGPEYHATCFCVRQTNKVLIW